MLIKTVLVFVLALFFPDVAQTQDQLVASQQQLNDDASFREAARIWEIVESFDVGRGEKFYLQPYTDPYELPAWKAGVLCKKANEALSFAERIARGLDENAAVASIREARPDVQCVQYTDSTKLVVTHHATRPLNDSTEIDLMRIVTEDGQVYFAAELAPRE